MADLFQWSEDLSVGSTFIDADHKKLIQMINNFHGAMQEGRANSVIEKVLNNLVIYTREHFAREEAEMDRINYAGSLRHKQEHAKLIKEVETTMVEFHTGKFVMSTKVAASLKSWLVDHIEQTDRKFAQAVRAF